MLVAGQAVAEERLIELEASAGLDKVEANCGICHSLDYIQMNARFLEPAKWDAEVTKMIRVMGAPINEADAKAIAEYLKAHYGAKPPEPLVPAQQGAEESCKREQEQLVKLRAKPVRVDVENFARGLQCGALRSQAVRLLESVGN